MSPEDDRDELDDDLLGLDETDLDVDDAEDAEEIGASALSDPDEMPADLDDELEDANQEGRAPAEAQPDLPA